MSRFPLMFTRCHECKAGDGVVPNTEDGRKRIGYIVVLPLHLDESHISTAWQRNPDFPEGEILHPTIDILSQEDTYIFDGDDPAENYRSAILKMKYLWSRVEVPVPLKGTA